MSITTIRKGLQELENLENLGQTKRIRKTGGGRKKIEIKNPKIEEDLEAIMGENTAGDPMTFIVGIFPESKRSIKYKSCFDLDS